VTDQNIRNAAQEYLAERLSAEGLTQEETLNRDAAIKLAPVVWRELVATVNAMVKEWNGVTKEQSLTCKETMLGDLRIRCASSSHQLTIHFESQKRLVKIDNTARPHHEPRLVLTIEGYAAEGGRAARLVHNRETVNQEKLLLRQIRMVSGLDRASDLNTGF
jgi:hypothetical protein